MSTSQTQLEADIAAQKEAIASLQTAAATQLAAIQTLQAQVAAGGTITADDLAALEANTKAITDVTGTMAPATPSPTA